MGELTHGHGRILLVAAESSGGADPVAEALRQSRLDVVACPDVYQGLARWCRPAGGHFDAAVVCLDGLDEAEYEFFRLARGGAGATPVFVYTLATGHGAVEEARRMGASGEIDATLAPLAGVVPPAKGPSIREDDAEPAARTGPGDGNGDVVRVPWKTDPDRPVRRPPQRSGALAGPDEVSGGVIEQGGPDSSFMGGDVDRDTPLLTEEEIDWWLKGNGDGVAESPPTRERMGR